MAFFDPVVERVSEILQVPEAWVQAAGLAAGGLLLAAATRRVMRRYVIPLSERTRLELDSLLLRAVAGPFSWTLGFLGIVGALRILLPDPGLEVAFTRTLTTGLLIIWGFAGAQLIVLFMRRGARRLYGGEAHVGMALVTRLTRVLVGVVIVLTLFSVWDVDLTPVLASAGLVGIALALAAQDTLSNFFAGLAVYLDQPYRVGDWVVLDRGTEQEIDGQVTDVGLRSTRIVTRDGVLVTVPNSIIANAQVVNESGHVPRYRVRVPVGVAYSTDLDRAETVLLEVAREHEEVIQTPEPRAYVRGFGDSSVNFELLAWIRTPQHRPRVVHELAKSVHRRFREEGITIPFPQRDVHLYAEAEPPEGR